MKNFSDFNDIFNKNCRKKLIEFLIIIKNYLITFLNIYIRFMKYLRKNIEIFRNINDYIR